MNIRHIVVGVDGSRSSRDGLRWAIAEAGLRGATVDAVHVWRYPALAYAGIMSAPAVARDEYVEGARALLDNEVDAVLAEEPDPPMVNRVILEGAVGDRLVRYAEDADLLVVGHGGRGGFADLLLGSVARHCSNHATCPVIVFRDTSRKAA